MTLVGGPLQWPVPLAAPLMAALAWFGLSVLAGRCPPGSVVRLLLRRARLSLALTLLLAGLLGWLHGRLEAMGWNLPSDAATLRDVLLTLGVMWTLLRLKTTLMQALAQEGSCWPARGDRERAAGLDMIDKTITAVVALLGGLTVLKLLGVSAAVLLTASGLGAAALGFGAKTLVENLLSGLMLYINRPFAVGDQIELPNQRLAGTVQAIGLFASELLTPDGEPLYLPNGLFTHSAVLNSSRRSHRRLLQEVALEVPSRRAGERIVAALRTFLEGHPLVRQDLPIRVGFSAFKDGAWQLRIECVATNELEGFQAVRQDLLMEVAERASEHGAALANGAVETGRSRSTQVKPTQGGADPP